MRRSSLHSLIGVLMVGLAGCASQSNEPTEANGEQPAAAENGQFEVTVNHAPFYYFSPAQSNGPDIGLSKGDAVEMIKKERGFSRVRTSAGKEGYIANDQLAPLPPKPTFTLAPNPEAPGRLQVVPLDQMLTPVEPPLPTADSTPSPTF